MKVSGTFTRGFLLGAGLMYLMDPSEGGRRRALVRGKGAVTRFRSGDAPDGVIEERVRATLGRIVSHPGAIRSMQVAAGALGAVVLVYGARQALQMWREGRDEGTLAPNYAYLR